MTLEISRQFFEKYSNIRFHENSSIGSRVVPCGRTDGQTDMTKLTVALRNFVNTPKNVQCETLSSHGNGSGDYCFMGRKTMYFAT